MVISTELLCAAAKLLYPVVPTLCTECSVHGRATVIMSLTCRDDIKTGWFRLGFGFHSAGILGSSEGRP